MLVTTPVWSCNLITTPAPNLPTIPLAQKQYRSSAPCAVGTSARNARTSASERSTLNHSIAKLTRTSSQYDANPCTILRAPNMMQHQANTIERKINTALLSLRKVMDQQKGSPSSRRAAIIPTTTSSRSRRRS